MPNVQHYIIYQLQSLSNPYRLSLIVLLFFYDEPSVLPEKYFFSCTFNAQNLSVHVRCLKRIRMMSQRVHWYIFVLNNNRHFRRKDNDYSLKFILFTLHSNLFWIDKDYYATIMCVIMCGWTTVDLGSVSRFLFSDHFKCVVC